MIPNEELIKAISNDMKNYLPEHVEIAFHNEFSYNPNANVDITLKMLRGEMTIKKLTQPVQFFIDVDELYFEDVFEAIKNYAVDRNSVTIPYSFREGAATITRNITMYYNTPQLLSNAIDKGIKKVATFTLEARYEIAENTFVQMNECEVNFYLGGSTAGHNLYNIVNYDLNVTRTYKTESKGGSVIPSNDILSIQTQLSLDYLYDTNLDATTDDGLVHRYLHKHATDKNLQLEINASIDDLEYQGTVALLRYASHIAYGSTLACHIDLIFNPDFEVVDSNPKREE